MPENAPVPLGRLPNATQDFNHDAGYNPAVPGRLMTNVYRDLAVRFFNDPQSNIVAFRMESSGGRSRVMIEFETVDAA